MCGIYRVYIVYQACPDDGPQIDSVYDNYAAAEDCIEAGRKVGLDRWYGAVDLQDEYVLEDDPSIPSEENDHG